MGLRQVLEERKVDEGYSRGCCRGKPCQGKGIEGFGNYGTGGLGSEAETRLVESVKMVA